jgi:putative ABC transport system permease protein
MTLTTLILRSLRFHARSHLGALLGAAVGSAVLIGALAVGDSVRSSLRRMAMARLGHIEIALASNDRFFRTNLTEAVLDPLDALAASALQLSGTAATGDGSARANRVQVVGVDERFWNFSLERPTFPTPAPDEVVLNESLAEQLKAKIGDTILLRVPKPSQLSRDAPISPQEDSSIALRVTVRAIARATELGRFSLQANQVPPFNAFVSLSWLEDRLGIPGRVNLLLVGSGANAVPEIADSLLRNHWQLADAELDLRELPGQGGVELRTSRVFLDDFVTQAALQVSNNAGGILTYFVNELRVGGASTPYSMVTAMGAPVVPADMRDDEIVISQWLADDLQAKVGDELELKYFVVGLARKLEEKSARFRVRAISSMSGPAADRTLMPDFPGLTNAKNCREWDSGFPIHQDRIREKDNKYWEDYRGTPKAIVTLAAGQKMWSNRFGNLTAVRYPAGTALETVAQNLRRSLNPALVGLSFSDVRRQAVAASEQSQDFGQLFLGFSFFLIAAALLLMALMFQFGIEQRTNEVGTLLALGFTPRQVRRLLLWEGAALALLGGLLGVAGGIGYAKAMLYGLATIWREAVGTSSLQYHASPSTLAIGAAASVIVAVLTIWLALRKQAGQPAYELLAEGAGGESQMSNPRVSKRSRGFWIGAVSGVLALLLLGWAAASKEGAPTGAFFGAGALLLIAGLGFAAAMLASLAGGRSGPVISDKAATRAPSLAGMGLRNCARRRKRSLATLGLLACGSFLVAAIGVFRLESNADAAKRSSGTGGFALIGESSHSIVQDLNSAEGREFYGLDGQALTNAQVVPLRVRDGEDASCLNLNRAQKPRLLGVQPELLATRAAFTFAKVAKGLPKDKPWMLLKDRASDGAVPAIGDQASIQWALGKQVGDTLDYTDERGQTFKIRLVASVANSILQGSLIMAEDAFVARFPNESGYRMFLLDAPSNQAEAIGAMLSRALQDAGLEVTSAARRLAMFNAVQNTYLNTFQVLGGLGLLLGSVGLGVVVLRNVLERRSELALLLAVGFRSRALKWLVISEHGALLVSGLGVGILAAFVAVWPALFSPGAEVPYRSLALTLGAVLLSGAIWTWVAAWLALRGRLLDALRNE